MSEGRERMGGTGIGRVRKSERRHKGRRGEEREIKKQRRMGKKVEGMG